MAERCAVYLRPRWAKIGSLCKKHRAEWLAHPLALSARAALPIVTGRFFLRWLDLKKAAILDAEAVKKARARHV
jgi:hypothetical protein